MQNDPEDFLNTEESIRELSSGKDSEKLFAGMVNVVLATQLVV